jgi:pimeloyl-ACP methyl ester carboxylesterase
MAERAVSVEPFPGYSPGVEECWMEMDGARMRYLRAVGNPLPAKVGGSGAPRISPLGKSPLILLHGLLGYSFSWRFTMPAVAPYTEIYAPDMMGAGFSDRPKGIDHSMRGCALRLLRFIEGLGIGKFDLLGTSHGGAVAMMAAAQCLRGQSKLKLRRLILVDPVNPYSAHGRRLAPFVGSRVGTVLFRHTVAHLRPMFSYWHARMYGDRSKIAPGTLEGYLAPLEKPGLFEHALSIVSTWTSDLRELEATLPTLAGIQTLLMWGGVDHAVYLSSAEKLQEFFPNSDLIVFPGVGHLPYEECPEEFNRALLSFLSRTA